MNTVSITEIKGIGKVDLQRPFTVRGKNKGEKAKPCKCLGCGDEIAVGEQYFRLDDYYGFYCLGCVTYS
jgi:hypothetical protein